MFTDYINLFLPLDTTIQFRHETDMKLNKKEKRGKPVPILQACPRSHGSMCT